MLPSDEGPVNDTVCNLVQKLSFNFPAKAICVDIF